MLLTGVRLFKLEYQVGDDLFRTTIASNNIENVMKLMRLAYPQGFRVTMSEDLGWLNAMTDEITKVIVDVREKPGTKTELKPELVKEEGIVLQENPKPTQRRGAPRRKTA